MTTTASLGVARLQRALDEAYARYAEVDEEARVQGLVEALHRALAVEPQAERTILLDQLSAGVTAPTAPRPGSPVQQHEVEELRAEVERLRVALAQASHAPQPNASAQAIQAALIGAEAGVSRIDEARVAAVVQALTSFATDLVKAFLSLPERRGDSVVQVDRFRGALRGELLGTAESGATERVLQETKVRIAKQMDAFLVACVKGARNLLNELDPVVLEEFSKEAGRDFLGMFRHQKMWEAFERRHRELAGADDLYDTYFDGAFRAAIAELRENK